VISFTRPVTLMASPPEDNFTGTPNRRFDLVRQFRLRGAQPDLLDIVPGGDAVAGATGFACLCERDGLGDPAAGRWTTHTAFGKTIEPVAEAFGSLLSRPSLWC